MTNPTKKRKGLARELAMLSPALPSHHDRDDHVRKKKKATNSMFSPPLHPHTPYRNQTTNSEPVGMDGAANNASTNSETPHQEYFLGLGSDSDSDDDEDPNPVVNRDTGSNTNSDVQEEDISNNDRVIEITPNHSAENNNDDDDDDVSIRELAPLLPDDDDDWDENIDDENIGTGNNHDIENNNNNNNDNHAPKVLFQSPPPPTNNGSKSFKAIDPINMLLPYLALKATFENIMICPVATCESRNMDDPHSLELDFQQYGFAAEMHIRCDCCCFGTAICPPINHEKGDTPNTTPTGRNKRPDRDSERFHKYGINCATGFLMQKLGVGMEALDAWFAYLGIAPNHGSDDKWRTLMAKCGTAAETVAEECMEENRKEELEATMKVADEEILAWLQSEHGKNATEETTLAKRREILMWTDGKCGVYLSADGAWQRRKIGKGGGDSTAGTNYGLGGCTQKIIARQAYSQHCRMCEKAAKDGRAPKPHRCGKNFDLDKSAKMMEPAGTAQHCIDIHKSKHNAYVCGLITDDNTTTRANVKHSLHDVVERNHPGTLVNGVAPSRLKRRLGWPVNSKNKLIKSTGVMPINVPEILLLLSDIQHRIRLFGKAVYDCRTKSEAKEKKYDGLDGAECENFKRSFAFFVKKNQHLCFEDFAKKAFCVLYHGFDKHHLCDKEWCAYRQMKDLPENERTKTYNKQKCRQTKSPEERKLYEMVKAKVMPLLKSDRMRETHHKFQTQKNETMNRKQTATTPKDRYFGGTMQLNDRMNLVVIVDSVGEYDGCHRLFHALGFPTEAIHNCLGLYLHNLDKEFKRKGEYRKKPENKLKRSLNNTLKMKEGLKKNKRARTEGCTYETGIATKGSDTDSEEEEGSGSNTSSKCSDDGDSSARTDSDSDTDSGNKPRGCENVGNET